MSLILGDWIGDSFQTFFKVNQIGIPLSSSAFTVILHNITGEENNTFWSTVTLRYYVPFTFSETVACSDGPEGNITEHNISVGKSRA